MAAPRNETFVRLTDVVADLVLSRLGNTGTDLLDDLFTKINTALAIPGELSVTGTNKVVSIGGTQVVTGPSGKLKTLPPLNGIDLGSRSGTFDFATGTGTGDVQNASLPTLTPNFFVKAGFQVTENGNIVVIFGNEGATASAATLPTFSENALPLGYVVLQDNGSGAFNNVLYSALYQISTLAGGSSEQSEAQDRNLKMVRGGTWLWNSVTGALSWSSAAALQIAGLAEARNNIVAGSVVLSADGQVAYVEANRTTGAPANLTVQTALISALADTPNTVIIARRVGNDVLVGNGTILLKNGERLELDGALAEINRYFGQLRLAPHASTVSKLLVAGADQTLLDGKILSQEMKNLLLSFGGAVINFQTGAILASDDTTPLGQNFTPFTIPVGSYFWYGIALIPSAVGSDNRIAGQILMTPASAANAVQANAPLPAIGGTKKLGAVLVQNVAGTITLVAIRALGVGSGSGGSGTGDANSLLEDLKARLRDSYFDWVTPNIFSTSEDDLVSGTSTASFDVANTVYKFTTPGQILLSIQQYGSAFLASDRASNQFELNVQWKTVDPAAVYEVSRDGGLNWGTFDMIRVGESVKYRGILVLPDPVNKAVLKSYPVSNADATTAYSATAQKVGIKFIVPAGQKLYSQQLTVYLNKASNPQGLLLAKIVKDVSGVPSEAIGDMVATAENSLAIANLAAGNVSGVFDLPAMLPAGSYWAVVQPDAAYLNNLVSGTLSYRRDGSAPTYADGEMGVYGVSSWSVLSGSDACFSFDGVPLDLRVRVTSSVSGAEMEGYGVFYGEAGPFTASVDEDYQQFTVDGGADQTTFTLTNFLPDAKRLLAFDASSGKVYHFPFFAVDGHNVVFPSGTFFSPGDSLSLVFRHLSGNGAFDNSDVNGSLLSANHLGSTDASVDKSIAGRGILIKRPDGTMRELIIDNADQIQILSVP